MVYVILHKSCSGILVIISLQNKNLYFNQFVIISYSIEWNGNAFITCDFASFKCVKSFPCFTKGVVNIWVYMLLQRNFHNSINEE